MTARERRRMATLARMVVQLRGEVIDHREWLERVEKKARLALVWADTARVFGIRALARGRVLWVFAEKRASFDDEWCEELAADKEHDYARDFLRSVKGRAEARGIRVLVPTDIEGVVGRRKQAEAHERLKQAKAEAARRGRRAHRNGAKRG